MFAKWWVPFTFGLAPGSFESDSEYFFVPNFGANWQIGTNSTVGVSVYGQGGMNTDWPTNVYYGSSPTGVDLSQLFVVPTWATNSVPSTSARDEIGSSPNHCPLPGLVS